jgi:hypothetical protein
MSEIDHIDCGYLATIQAMADERWLDPIKNIDLIANADAAKAVLENQSVKLGELQVKDKKRVVSLEWLTDCDGDTQSCSDDCTLSGSDSTPECKEYEITCLQESEFKVGDRAYRERTINPRESIAFLLERRMKLLDEWIANYILTALHLPANLGTNVYTGAPGTVAGSNTTISAIDWNDNIWGYLALVTKMNQFTNPYIITGQNLFQLVYNRAAEYANADGKGNVNKMGFLQNRIYFDPFNVESVAANHTFLIHKGAVAFISKAWYPLGGANAVELVPGQFAYSLNSRNLPGVVYDVFTQRTCLSNEYYTAFKVQLHGTFALNPTPCSETNTGVLQLLCS